MHYICCLCVVPLTLSGNVLIVLRVPLHAPKQRARSEPSVQCAIVHAPNTYVDLLIKGALDFGGNKICIQSIEVFLLVSLLHIHTPLTPLPTTPMSFNAPPPAICIALAIEHMHMHTYINKVAIDVVRQRIPACNVQHHPRVVGCSRCIPVSFNYSFYLL